MLPASGLENVREETAGNPMAAVGEKLFLAGLAGNMRAAILAAAAATAGQVEALQARVKAAARQPRTVSRSNIELRGLSWGYAAW
jgi:hypothetical protein